MEFQTKNNRTIHALVTGVGAIIGYGVIKSLRQSGLPVYIVGMDIYEDAVGQHWCDKFVQAKYAVDPDYIQFLKGVIRENQIDIVFFGTEQEVYRTDGAREELGEDLAKLVLQPLGNSGPLPGQMEDPGVFAAARPGGADHSQRD